MNTRQEILDYLENHPYACAEDLSPLITRTRANIQYHLKRMEQAGLITQVRVLISNNDRGRPRSYYSLSSGEKPDNLALLADALLRLRVNDTLASAQSMEKLVDLGWQIISIQSGISSLTARLNRLVKELSARNYQARWEAHADGPEVVFRNCPYAQIIQNHPELCAMDAAILEANLDARIEAKAFIRNSPVTACRFFISPLLKKFS